MSSLISLAGKAPSVYTASRFYERMGFSIIPCAGKKPGLYHWAHLQQRRASRETIDLWHKTGLLENVGIICGAVSGNLAVVDLDGAAAVSVFRSTFPDLTATYAVRSGSGKGMHFYYYCNHLPPTTRYVSDGGNIELRANGCYVVAPPSIHPASRQPYIVAQDAEIKRVDDLRPLVELLRSLIASKHGGKMPPPSNAKVINATAYGRAALRGECDKVRAALAGGRNHALYEAALRMGSLIADRKVGRGEVEQALSAAAGALSDDDGAGATWRTIESGLNAGMENSRERHTKRA